MIETTVNDTAVAPKKKSKTALGVLYFILQRLGFGAFVLLTIIFLSYMGLDMAGGDNFGEALSRAIPKTAAYVGRLLQGDLGLSTAATSNLLSLPVIEVLPEIVLRSLGLLGVSLFFAALIGVLLGVLAATRRGSNRSLTILLASIIGVSVPSFFIALLLQMLMIQWTRQTGSRLLPVGGFGWDKHIILPALVLATRPIAQITRVTFLAMHEALAQDYVRTAHSKGLRSSQVLFGHVFRNAAVPVLTTIGLSLRFSLSSLPVVEFFFGWPGIGFILLKAIAVRDNNMTIALLLSLGILFILVNLALELAYRLIDPRLQQMPEHIAAGERRTARQTLRDLGQELRDLAADNPLTNWRQRRTAAPSPFTAILEKNQIEMESIPENRLASAWYSWRRGIIGNLPFVLGGLLVTGLLIIFLIGPRLAPHSPYTTQGLSYVDGVFSVPPFAPDETYPWGTDILGRDMLSLVLAGAQQTLLLASLAVLARMALGVVLGALAGWLNGTWVDRLILAASEIVASFPTLLLAMILILALGIREGLRPFLIAFSLIGWGEIMQFVRGEVMSIRPRMFIESAVAVGLRTSRIIIRHVLPNLLPALISLAALEMGAALMLLGELGFVGIFIGGGAFAELDIGAAPYHYSDVPEWGSLLSNVRTYARTYPWTAVTPSLAFFTAILGFNLFGEGLRRVVEIVGVRFTRLLNRYSFALALLVILSIGWVRQNTGAVTFYRQQAAEFDGRLALEQVQALTDPALDGRSLGTPGLNQAADYIAAEFDALGLQAAGEDFTYFQPRFRDFERLDAVPQLTIDDGGATLVYRQDYAEFPSNFRNMGEASGKVHFLATGALTQIGGSFSRQTSPALKGLDFSNEILMVLSPQDTWNLRHVPRKGFLIVAEDDADVGRRYTLSTRDPVSILFGTSREVGQDTPALLISEAAADHILASINITVADLRRAAGDLNQDQLLRAPTETEINMTVAGTLAEREEVVHVVGHMPGVSEELDSQMIIVMAQYDSPPPSPDGVYYPGANDNASGVALMLETIRVMQESGYQPYKTFLFVAYSAEGLEGGNAVYPPEVTKFLEAKYGFGSAFEVESVVDLRGVGAGGGDGISIAAGGSLRLANLLEMAADQMDVKAYRVGEPVDISIIFEDRSVFEGGQEAPQVGLSWQGWKEQARLASDTLETIAGDKMERAGQALTLALMIMGRETQY